jgi:hypothetical protein
MTHNPQRLDGGDDTIRTTRDFVDQYRHGTHYVSPPNGAYGVALHNDITVTGSRNQPINRRHIVPEG